MPLLYNVAAETERANPVWPVTPDAEKYRIIALLARSLARDGIGDDLIATLNELFRDTYLDAPRHEQLIEGFFVRAGLPLRRRRPPSPAPMDEGNAARIKDHFDRATRRLVHMAPHRTTTYPTTELNLLVAYRNSTPAAAQMKSFLRRYALAILAVIDLMGDDE